MPDLAECHRWAVQSERIDDDLRLYPVLASSWIDIGQDAYDWAAETASIEGVEDHFGWGAAWMCYLSGAILNTAHPDRIVAALDRFATISADDPTYELALRGHANGNGVFTGRNWSLALSVYDQPAAARHDGAFQPFLLRRHGLRGGSSNPPQESHPRTLLNGQSNGSTKALTGPPSLEPQTSKPPFYRASAMSSSEPVVSTRGSKQPRRLRNCPTHSE